MQIESLRKQITEAEEMRNEWEIESRRHVEEISKLERLCENNRMEIADLNEYNRVNIRCFFNPQKIRER